MAIGSRIRRGVALAGVAAMLAACSSGTATTASSSAPAATSAASTSSATAASATTAGSTSTSSAAGTTSKSGAASSAEDSSASESGTSESGTSGAATVMTATGDLGTFLVGANGMTLYMFTPDTGGTSTCYDQCATAWPPLLVTGTPVVGEGLDDSLLSTVDRTDGTKQVVYGDWPLYYWAKDTKPGDTTGQGVGTKWYVVDPDGEPIGMGAAATSSN